MTQQKTPWFKSSEHDPARRGVYLVKRQDGELWWRAFNGKDWFIGVRADPASWGLPSPSYAKMMDRRNIEFYKIYGRQFEWCGLANKLD
jgi:hypothetical protein